MKIAILSDTHSLDIELPQADFLIHAGDMTVWGTIEEVARFAQRLNASEYQGGVIVPGNHDGVFEHMPVISDQMFDERFKVLVDKRYEWKGLTFYGSPWTPPFGNYSFMMEEDRLRRVYGGMPMELDFLVTHGPPRGILDSIGDDHVGSYALREAVHIRNIRHHVFGHIHAAAGRPSERWRGIEFHNVCTSRIETVIKVKDGKEIKLRRYAPAYPARILEVESK